MLVSRYLILKKDVPHFIQHQASKIEYLVLFGSNVNVSDILISDFGLSELEFKKRLLEFITQRRYKGNI